MGFVKEFKEFAVKGNVIDLAVGVVIGAAFQKIVSSFVEDIITPAILTPVLNAAHLKNLSELVISGTAIKYGNFLSQVLSFVIVAFVLFVFIKAVNRVKRKEEAEAKTVEVVPPAPSKEESLLAEIRDLLKNQQKG